MQPLYNSSETTPESARLLESQERLKEIRELFSSQGWRMLSEELESLYQWYRDRMEAATNHDEMIRAQAKCQVLRALFGDTLGQMMLAKQRPTIPQQTDYMDQDYLDRETQ